MLELFKIVNAFDNQMHRRLMSILKKEIVVDLSIIIRIKVSTHLSLSHIHTHMHVEKTNLTDVGKGAPNQQIFLTLTIVDSIYKLCDTK